MSTVLIVVYCIFIVLASLLGGWLPSFIRLTHTRMQLVMSLVAGLMLGVALLHLLPEAAHQLEAAHYLPGPKLQWATGGALVGLLVMFFLIRTFHFHQHGPVDDGHTEHADEHHDDDHAAAHKHENHHGHELSWMGLAVGLSVHTLLDGVALGAAVSADSGGQSMSFAIFLAIVLHKPLDALSITSLMAARGWAPGKRQVVNAGFAMMCPLGALLFWISHSQLPLQEMILGGALAFSAGVFLCISLGDLLPEVHFHRHDRFKLSAALLLGVALALGIEMLPGHSHSDHEKSHSEHHHDND